MGRKFGEAVLLLGGAGSPSNTMWLGPRPTTTKPSFILIRPSIWSQYYTNITDRQDRQKKKQSDSTGRTVLQTVHPKIKKNKKQQV